MKAPFIAATLGTLGLIACTMQQSGDTSGSASSQSSASSIGIVMSKRACVPDDFHMPAEQAEEWANSWNNDPATMSVPFENAEKGFSVQIPYNPSWGNRNCQLEPYIESGARLTYGFAGIFEGGGAMRFNSITVIPQRSADAAAAAIKAQQDAELAQGILPANPKPDIVTIGGKTAVQYYNGGFCDFTFTEVIGKVANYLFASTCNVDTPGTVSALESLTIHE